jgi:hypothetical protein
MAKKETLTPNLSALVGVVSVIPFLLANYITINNIEPFMSMLRPTGHTTIFEHILLYFLLFVLPVIGAGIASYPMLRRGKNGKRRLYLLNAIITVILLAGSIILSIVLGAEIYECDVLRIPHCD